MNNPVFGLQLVLSAFWLSVDIDLSNVTIGTSSYISGAIKGTLNLNNFGSAHQSELNLLELRPENGKIGIELVGADVNKINFKYKNFKLIFPTGTPDDDIANTYQNLLENFKARNDQASLQAVDIEFKQFKNSKKAPFLNGIENIFQKYCGITVMTPAI